MTRLTQEERDELISAGPSLTRAMGSLESPADRFAAPDGSLDRAAIASFLNQMNALLGHRRKPFSPILGEFFLL